MGIGYISIGRRLLNVRLAAASVNTRWRSRLYFGRSHAAINTCMRAHHGTTAEGMSSRSCSICNKKIVGDGNNALPLARGRCCNECNMRVMVFRMRLGALQLLGEPLYSDRGTITFTTRNEPVANPDADAFVGVSMTATRTNNGWLVVVTQKWHSPIAEKRA